MVVKRVDPEDGKAYTFVELKRKYGIEFTEAEVREFWEHECEAASGFDPTASDEGSWQEGDEWTADPRERRIDPEDNRVFTYEEFKSEKWVPSWEGKGKGRGKSGPLLDGKRIVVGKYGSPDNKRHTDSPAVFVAGVSFDTTYDELKDLFSQAGEVVRLQLFIDRATGRHKGSAKVQFKDDQAVRKAIELLHGKEIGGRCLHVRDFSAGSTAVGKGIFVSGLSSRTTAEGLQEFFSSIGEVLGVVIFTDRGTGASKQIAKVDFASEELQLKAIAECDGCVLDGRRITVREFSKPYTVATGATGHTGKSCEEYPVFVGGLNFETDLDELKAHFNKCADVAFAHIMTDKATGKSKGVAKVSFFTKEAQRKALEEWNLSQLHGRRISVQDFHLGDISGPKGKPGADKAEGKGKDGKAVGKGHKGRSAGEKGEGKGKEDKGDSKGKGSRGNSGHQYGIFVGGLTYDVTTADVKAHFQDCGEVAYASVMVDKDTGKSRGRAKVAFYEEAAQQRAIAEWNGSQLKGRAIIVRDFEKSGKGDLGGFKLVGGKGKSLASQDDKPARVAQNASSFNPDSLLAAPLPSNSAQLPSAIDGEKRKIDPDDGKLYSLKEVKAKYGGQFSADEVRDFWEFEMQDERMLSPPRPTETFLRAGSHLSNMGLKEFLVAVDAQWLRHLVQPHPCHGVREFSEELEKQFESVEQILRAYSDKRPDGKRILKDKFFDDVGMKKLGHRRIVNKWIAANT